MSCLPKWLSKDLRQIYALTLKDFTLQFRQWKANICQLLTPIICMLFVLLLQIIVDEVVIPLVDTGDFTGRNIPSFPLDINTAQMILADNNKTFPSQILYSISEYGERKYIEDLTTPMINLKYDSSEDNIDELLFETLEDHADDKSDPPTSIPYFGSLKIDDFLTDLRYTVQHEDLPEFDEHQRPTMKTQFCLDLDDFANGYCEFGLSIGMMDLIHNKYISNVTDGYMSIKTYSSQQPYFMEASETVVDLIDLMGSFFYPLILLLGIPTIMYSIALEKETQLKEMMRLMGLKERNYVISTFCFKLLWFFISVVLFVSLGLILQHRIFYQTNLFVLLLVFFGIGLQVVSTGFFFASFITSSFVATIAGYLLVLFVPIFGVFLIMFFMKPGEYAFKFLLIIPSFPVVDVIYHMVEGCSRYMCFGVDDIFGNTDFLISLIFLYVDSIIYFFLALYLEKVAFRTWGVRKGPCFCLSWIPELFKDCIEMIIGDHWIGRKIIFRRRRKKKKSSSGSKKKKKKKKEDPLIQKDEDKDVKDVRENILGGNVGKDDVGILVRGLVKKFGRGKSKNIAVKKVFLDIQKKECFGLLGPNGAGKTTLIRVLCGIFGANNGTAYLGGYDIRTKMEEIRTRIGVCPQFSIVWPELTPSEHLLFYSRLKGVDPMDEEVHVAEILEKVGLKSPLKGFLERHHKTYSSQQKNTKEEEEEEEDMKEEYSQTKIFFFGFLNRIFRMIFPFEKTAKQLSGGMQRRLAIGIALAGNPSIILLDEPSTGLDATNRREIWDVILKEKEGRCVVLTTHSMEEADVLSDRIAIMSHGRIAAVGSSLHLKKRFGNGYSLHIKAEEEENIEKIIEYVETAFEDFCSLKVIKRFGEKISYQLLPKKIKIDSRSSSENSTIVSNSTTTTTTNDDDDNNAMLIEEEQEEQEQRRNSDDDDNVEEEEEVESILRISEVFEKLEREKNNLGIIDFVLNQTTLEDVFLNVVRLDEEKIINERQKKTNWEELGLYKDNNEEEEEEKEEEEEELDDFENLSDEIIDQESENLQFNGIPVEVEEIHEKSEEESSSNKDTEEEEDDDEHQQESNLRNQEEEGGEEVEKEHSSDTSSSSSGENVSEEQEETNSATIEDNESSEEGFHEVLFEKKQDTETSDISNPEEEEVEKKKKTFLEDMFVVLSTFCCLGSCLKEMFKIMLQTVFLSQKNCILSCRSWKTTCVQICSPFIVVLVIFLIFIIVEADRPGWYIYPETFEISTNSLEPCVEWSGKKCHILAYAHNDNKFAIDVMNDVVNIYNLELGSEYVVFSSTFELESYLSSNQNMTQTAISFSNSTKDQFGKMNQTTYTLYFNGTKDMANQVIPFKVIIDNSILRISHKMRGVDPNTGGSINAKRESFPMIPTYSQTNGQSTVFRMTGPVFFSLLAFVLFIVSLYKIVMERELGLREGLEMIGMRKSAYVCSWLINFSVLGVLMSIVTILSGYLFMLDVFIYCNPVFMFILFFLFDVSLILFAFAISTMITKTKTALIIGFIIVAISFILNFFIASGTFVYIFLSLEDFFIVIPLFFQIFYPPFNFGKMFSDIINKSMRIYDSDANKFVANEGFWGFEDLFEVNEATVMGMEVSVQPAIYSLLFLILNCIIFSVLFWYLDSVCSDGRSCFFCCSPFYYCKSCCSCCCGRKNFSKNRKVGSNTLSLRKKEIKKLDDDILKEYQDCRDSTQSFPLRVVGLKKTFRPPFGLGKKTRAVRRIDLKLDENQIVGLLGPNGAGKSSCISSVAGVVKFNRGEIFVDGMNRKLHEDEVRECLGVTLQENFLWDELSAYQHLRLFCQIKGIVCPWQWKKQIKKRLKEVSLYDVRNDRSKTFSGGMKRRLSIAMAYVGSPKVIVLDEPSVGLDPYSKREVWKLIKEKCQIEKCSTLFSTHSMEECDTLSHRIVIMKDGLVKCIGDSMTLKKKYGKGFVLKVSCIDIYKMKEFVVFLKNLFPNGTIKKDGGLQYKIVLEHIYTDELILGLKMIEDNMFLNPDQKKKNLQLQQQQQQGQQQDDEEEEEEEDIQVYHRELAEDIEDSTNNEEEIKILEDDMVSFHPTYRLVKNFGLSNTTLEDVYLHVTKGEEEEEEVGIDKIVKIEENEDSEEEEEEEKKDVDSSGNDGDENDENDNENPVEMDQDQEEVIEDLSSCENSDIVIEEVDIV